MVNLIDLGTFTDDGNIQVVVEMPKGARIKAKYDPTIAAFCYVRPLAAGLAYPMIGDSFPAPAVRTAILWTR